MFLMFWTTGLSLGSKKRSLSFAIYVRCTAYAQAPLAQTHFFLIFNGPLGWGCGTRVKRRAGGWADDSEECQSARAFPESGPPPTLPTDSVPALQVTLWRGLFVSAVSDSLDGPRSLTRWAVHGH